MHDTFLEVIEKTIFNHRYQVGALLDAGECGSIYNVIDLKAADKN